MGNICYLTPKDPINVEKITADLEQICQVRFQGLLEITQSWEDGRVNDFKGTAAIKSGYRPTDGDVGEIVSGWRLEFKDSDLGYNLYLHSTGDLSHKHRGNQLVFWTSTLIHNELAIRYNGLISDEGIPDIWEGDTSKYPTYRSWVKAMHPIWMDKPTEEYLKAIEHLKEADLEHCPNHLKSFLLD